jgi:hypothetical protein
VLGFICDSYVFLVAVTESLIASSAMELDLPIWIGWQDGGGADC